MPSPRRVCSVPANKRVEMLRNCETDLRRELSKARHADPVATEHHGPPLKPLPVDHNPAYKRVEELRHETSSVPSSPKSSGRYSPRKTHVSNFINQYGNLTELNRRRSSPEPVRSQAETPNLQLNGVHMRPPRSPKPRRRFRSQSPRVCIAVSESDSDHEHKNAVPKRKGHDGHIKSEINGNVESLTRKLHAKERALATDDVINRNVVKNATNLVSFNSVGMGNAYCPQSEPLKRKVYSEKTLDRLQKSLEMESGECFNPNKNNILQCIRGTKIHNSYLSITEIPKKALLQKISLLRLERQAAKAQNDSSAIDHRLVSSVYQALEPNTTNGNIQHISKRQMILNTIEDLKRNLEDQKVELYGLNEDE